MIRNNVFLSSSLGYPFPSNVNLQNVLVIVKRQFYVADRENKKIRKKTTPKNTSNTFILPKPPLRQSADCACHKAHPSFVHCQSKLGSWKQIKTSFGYKLIPFVPASKLQGSCGIVCYGCTYLVSENNDVNEDSYHWECLPLPKSQPKWSF